MESWFMSHYFLDSDGCFTLSLPFKDTDRLPVFVLSKCDRRLLALERGLISAIFYHLESRQMTPYESIRTFQLNTVTEP